MIVIVDAATGAQIDEFGVDGASNGQADWRVTGPSDRSANRPAGVDPCDNAVQHSPDPADGDSRVEGGDCETGNVRLETGSARRGRRAARGTREDPGAVSGRPAARAARGAARRRVAAPPDARRRAGRVGQDDAPGPVRRPGGRPGGLVPRRDLGRRRGVVRAPPRGRAAVRAARTCPAAGRPSRTSRRRSSARPGPRRLLVIDDGHALEGTAAEARARAPRRLRPAVAGGHRRQPRAAVDQPAAAPRVRRAPGARAGRPAVPRLGGRAAVPRRLPRPGAAGRPRGARPPHRGLGGGPAAVPPRDPRPVRRRAPAGPQRRRDRAAGCCASTWPRTCCSGCRRTCASSSSTRACSAGCPGRCAIACAGTTGSGALLDELARRSVFTVPVEDADGAFRYHEVLRQHLDRMLVEADRRGRGPRDRHAQAGSAARGRRRASGGAAARTAGRRTGTPSGACWADRASGSRRPSRAAGSTRVPPAIERHDPWVALAAARRARNDGRWSAAIDGYVRAEAAFGPARAADAPRRERQRIAAWLDPVAMPTPDAIGALRTGLVREPVLSARDAARLDDASAPVARGLLHLAAGEVVDRASACSRRPPTPARRARSRVRRRGSGRWSPPVSAARHWDARAMDRAIEEAERAGSPWLARLGRSLALRLDPQRAGARTRRGDAGATTLAQDAWGQALLDLAEALGRVPPTRSGACAAADAATVAVPAPGRGRARGLGARPGGARGGEPRDAGRPRRRARRGVGGSRGGVAGRADVRLRGAGRRRRGPWRGVRAARRDRGGRDGARRAPDAGRHGCPGGPGSSRGDRGHGGGSGVRVRRGRRPRAPNGANGANGTNGANGARPFGRAPPVRIRTLGGFALDVDGRRVLLDGAKPRVRSLLRLLAVHAGAAVHREVIQDALWPEADAAAGARSLHVALSALRRWLDEAGAAVGGSLVAREGDAYRLDVAPTRSTSGASTARWPRAGPRARAASSRRPRTRSRSSCTGASSCPRKARPSGSSRGATTTGRPAVEAAGELASESMLAGDYGTAVRACRFGLEIDRYQDSPVADPDRGADRRRRHGGGEPRPARVRGDARGARGGRRFIGLHGPRRARLIRRRRFALRPVSRGDRLSSRGPAPTRRPSGTLDLGDGHRRIGRPVRRQDLASPPCRRPTP